MKHQIKYFLGSIVLVGLFFGFQNCSNRVSFESASIDSTGTSNLASTADSSPQLQEQTDLQETFPADINLSELEKVNNSDWINQAESPTTKDTANICSESVKIQLSLANDSSTAVTFKNSKTNEVDSINIHVCKKAALENADYKIGDIGFYKRENIIKACPSGFHPLERMELQHINADAINNVVLNKGNTIFKNGLETRGIGTSQLWTFDNMKTSVSRFSAIYVNTVNSKRTVTIQNDVESGDNAELALPVVCVDDHHYSRNAKSDIQLGGCEYLFNFDGLKVCHKPSLLFKDYSRIFNTEDLSKKADNEMFANHIGIKFKKTSTAIMHSLDSVQLPANVKNLTCPVGFIQSQYQAVQSIISSGLSASKIALKATDIYCVKNDENYAAKLFELSGCSAIKNVDGLKICRQETKLKVCLPGYHFFNAAEFESKKNLLFEMNQSNQSMQFPLEPSYFVSGNDDQVFVEGLAVDTQITYCWIHNGSRTCRLSDGAQRGWRLTSKTSTKMSDTNQTVETSSLRRICVQD